MIEIRQTESLEEWFSGLPDGRARARIDVNYEEG
jgi:putative component of toxin-antitoxin plasmid stabilization module